MKLAFNIFVNDLRRLVSNPFALVVVLGLIILPSVYAWYSVAAMWNPYSHTDGLKVAVVNADAGSRLGDVDGITLSKRANPDEEVNVGAMLVEGMKEDHSFNWQFVDADQGKDGLESGEYYAEFVMPESFTHDFLSVLSDNPANPTIEYWVNEKYNAVALEVTDAGAGVVDAVVNRVFTALVTDVLVDVVKDVADDLLNAGVTAKSQAQARIDTASRDVTNVQNGLADAQKSIDEWTSSVDDVKKSLDALKSSIPDLRTSLEDGEKLLADVRATSHEVTSAYSSALAQGGPELESALKDISKRIGSVADDIEDKQASVTDAVQKAQKALQECDKLIATLRKADPDSKTLVELEERSEKLEQEIEALETASEAIGEAAAEVGDVSSKAADDLDKTISGMKKRNDSFNKDVLPQIDTSLDAIALVMGSVDGMLESFDGQVDQAKTLLNELAGVLQRLKSSLTEISDSLGGVTDSLKTTQTDLASLGSSSFVKKLSGLASIDVKSYGSQMASPVSANINAVYPLNSYGTGVAPFYTSLAIWVGCFMLIAVIKLEVNPLMFPRMRPWQGYVGRLMLFGSLALLQGLVVTVGDMAIGVQAVNPLALILAGLVVAFCFVNIVYALAITFKHVGKALAVIFLVIQIPGASGMYPIQLMPEFFQALYPWLPFTYGMGAMREAIGGFYGAHYAQCMAWLLACGLVAMALALIVRPRLLNLNRLFDRKLEIADLYITEEHGLGTDVRTDHPVVNSLLGTSIGRAEVVERMKVFAYRYGVIKQAAPLAIIVLTICLALVTGVLQLDTNGKLIALVLFIAAVVIIFCACVAFEFVYDNMTAELQAAGIDIDAMHADEPRGKMREIGLAQQAVSESGIDVNDLFTDIDYEAVFAENDDEEDAPLQPETTGKIMRISAEAEQADGESADDEPSEDEPVSDEPVRGAHARDDSANQASAEPADEEDAHE